MDFAIPHSPTPEEIVRIQEKVNQVIRLNLPVRMEYIPLEEARTRFDLNRLPPEPTETVWVVKIGDFDECLCIGSHVENTAAIGQFLISSHSYENGIFRIRFKLQN